MQFLSLKLLALSNQVVFFSEPTAFEIRDFFVLDSPSSLSDKNWADIYLFSVCQAPRYEHNI